MHHRVISARVDDVRAELSKLLSHLEEFPTPLEVKQHSGAVKGPAWIFTQELREATSVASTATKVMIEELANAEETIRAVLGDLTAHDEDVKDSADRFVSFIENAVDQTAADGTDTPAAGPPTVPTAAPPGGKDTSAHSTMGDY